MQQYNETKQDSTLICDVQIAFNDSVQRTSLKMWRINVNNNILRILEYLTRSKKPTLNIYIVKDAHNLQTSKTLTLNKRSSKIREYSAILYFKQHTNWTTQQMHKRSETKSSSII